MNLIGEAPHFFTNRLCLPRKLVGQELEKFIYCHTRVGSRFYSKNITGVVNVNFMHAR